MTKDEYLERIANIVISTFWIKLHEAHTSIAQIELFGDDSVFRQRRHGIFGWILDTEDNEYSSAIDWPIEYARFENPKDLYGFAKVVEYRLKELFKSGATPKYTTSEAIIEAVRELEPDESTVQHEYSNISMW